MFERRAAGDRPELHLRVVHTQVRIGDLSPAYGDLDLTIAPRGRMKDARVRIEARRNDGASVLPERVQPVRDPLRGGQVVNVLEWHRDTLPKRTVRRLEVDSIPALIVAGACRESSGSCS